ncbi:putative cadherin domain-containing protein [Synechococcus sp. BIOS-U3-1]|nr:putative cadherin domain-containing protein [Synechococcus sp. BIOS-U3-1]
MDDIFNASSLEEANQKNPNETSRLAETQNSQQPIPEELPHSGDVLQEKQDASQKRPVTSESLQELWHPQLQEWAEQGDLLNAAVHALHLDPNQPPTELTTLVERLVEGETSDLPKIELLQHTAMPGAAGAYSATKQTIYLNSDWANTTNQSEIVKVLSEEFGHHLDSVVHPQDTSGDEGKIFAEFLTGGLHQHDIHIHQSEKWHISDQGQIKVNGEVIDVEFSQTSTALQWIQVGDEIEGRKKQARSGYTVSLSSDGSIVAIGSWNDRTIGSSRGSVAVYQLVNNSWQALGNVLNGTNNGDRFGAQVSLSADGSRLGVGTPRDDDGGKWAGSVSIYELQSGTWTKLGSNIDGVNANNRAGGSLALSGDGSTVIVGAERGHTKQKGYAGVYTWNGTTWGRVGARITGTQKKEYSGKSVAISEDGSRVAVGSWAFDSSGNDRGRVRVYDNVGGTWTLKFNIFGEKKNDFASSVSLSDNGNILALGAAQNDGGGNNSGHARVYDISGSREKQLGDDINGTTGGQQLGGSVSLSSNGQRLAVGAQYADGTHSNSGRVTIFDYNSSSDSWTKVGSYIKGVATGDRASAGITGLSLSGDGKTVAIGAPFHDGDTNALKDAGHVRVFTASGLTIAQASTPLVTTEAGSTASFTVVLDAKPTDNVTVSITGDDSTEHSLSASSLTFTTSNWNTAQTVTVTGVDDSLDDGDITTTLTATASNTGGYAGTEQATTTLKTSDDDTAGITIAQASTPLVTTEAGSTASFTVVLDAKPTDNVTVSITGDDSTEHSLSASSLTFTTSNWNTAQTVTVTGVDDSLDDGDITTTLTATASNTGGYAGTEQATTTLKTSDDDTAGITIAQASTPLVTTEAGSTSTFTVVLDAKPTDNVTVSITGDDSTEHSLSASSLTFTTSNWNTAQTVTVTGVDDSLDDGDITTTLTATASNTGGYAGTEQATTTLKTSDDDTAGITIAQASTPLVTTEAGSTASFTVVLDAKPTDNVTVSITGDDSTEHSLSASSLTFTTSNWNTAQTVTVTGVDDSLDDGDITTTLTATASNTGGYAGTEQATTTLKTSDDDTAGITIAQASTPLVTTEAGSTASFTVVLDAKPTDNVTVSITGDDSTEHSLSASSLTFTTSNWNTAQTVTVTGVDDSLDDGDITTTLTATASNTGGYAGTEQATTTLKTSDDDTAGITIAQASTPLVTTEAGSTASFTVVLDAKPTDNVTVSITGDDSTEHSLSASSLTFTTSNWNTAQTVTVTGVDDSLDDGDITTTLTATASNTGGYAGTEQATATLKTSDDDTAGITIAQTGTTDGSGNLLTTEAGSTSTFTVVLNNKPTADVTVSLTGDDSTEHSLSASSLTFTSSNWNTAQTVTVTGVDDSIVDGDITTTLTATASNTGGYAGTEQATTTLKTSDNDNPPSIADRSDDVLESTSSGTELLDLADANSGNDTDQDGDAITYSISDGNDADLFAIEASTGKISLAAGQSLHYETSDLHTLEITATDGVKTTTADISINVIDVNNAPVADADTGSVNENETLSKAATAGLILDNDTDSDGDSLVISNFHAGDLSEALPRIGQFNTALDGDYGQLSLQTDGSYSYTANKAAADALAAGETGIDIFSYRVSDTKLTDRAELAITVTGVNDQPFLVDAIKTKKYTEGQINIPLIIDGSLDIRDVDDTNIESATVSISSTTFVSTEDTLAFTSVYGISSNWNSTSGVLTLSGSATKANYINALQTVTYTNTNTSNPEAGARTIQWLVNDGAANSTAIESNIIVLGQNDAPEASNDTASVDGGSTVTTQTNLLANDTDPEGHSRSITSFRIGNEQESNAGFSPGATVTGSYGKMTIQSDGTYSYQAQETAAYKLLAGETATETYTYTITDSQTVDEGIDSGEITITITGVNDSPTAIDDTAKIDEDSSKQFEDHLGILKNDTDIDGDQLYIKSVRAGAETSRRSLNTGTDGVSQNSTSETETQSNETVSETQSESSDSESSSESSDTGTSNESSKSESSSESSDTGTSNENSDSESSSESSDTGASSESLDTEIQSKKIESGNQSSSVNSLSTEIKGTYGSLTVNPNGSYRYTANLADALDSGDKEIDRFTYTLTDLSSDDSAEMAIEVTGINDAPVLAAITGGTIADQTNSSSLVTSNISGQLSGTDADASAVLSFGITGNSSSTSSGNYGTLSLNRSTGAYEYLPTTAVIEALNQGDSVSDSFEVYVSDGSLSATQTFQVNITGANDSNGSSGGSGAGSTGSDSGNSNTDRSNATPSELIKNTDGSGFQVTGSNGVWVQLEVLRANADWQNSLQIVNSEGHAIGSIGATKNSTNMGSNEIFLSGGSEIKFHQSSNHQKLNHSPKLQINSELDNSFSLHLEDSDQQNPDYDDLSIKITSSQQPKNINAFKLSSQQNRINDPLLKMTDLNPGGTKLRITLTSDCGDTNRIAFVKLTANDHDGFSVGGIASTEENTFEAAVRDSLINPGDTEILMQGNNARQIDWTFNQNDEGFYAPVFINQETGNLVTYGVNNTFNGMGSIKNLGGNFFGYEDTLSAQDSDWDFNDMTMLVEMI